MRSYYEAEIRDGFYVSSVMKRNWAARLEVLLTVGKVLKENNITYFADWGTLLGVVRHGGFIPWDDDLDIAIKRPDYDRIYDILLKGLPKSYVISDFHNNKESFDNPIISIMNIHGVSTEPAHLEMFHGLPYAASIDIFPLDYLPRDMKAREKLREEGLKKYAEVEKLNGENRRKELVKLDGIMASYTEEDSDHLTSMVQWIKRDSLMIPKEYYDDCIELPFEYTVMPVPARYADILKILYTDGYMNPIRDWDCHEYPAFKKMEDYIKNVHHIKVMPEYVYNDIIDKTVRRATDNKKHKVFFLPVKAEWWEYFYNVYEEEVNAGNEVYVMPVPYYVKSKNGSMKDISYDGELFKGLSGFVPFDSMNLEKIHPDKIYMQCPYDDCDSGISVHPFFYSDKLRAYTDELVYIPYFSQDDFKKEDARCMQTTKYFVTMPGVVNADKVILESETLKERYIDALIQMSGSKAAKYWRNKIEVKQDLYTGIDRGDVIYESEIPEDWAPFLKDSKGNYKKVLLYYTSFSEMAGRPKDYLDKITDNINVFAENSEVMAYIWIMGEDLDNEIEGSSEYRKFDELKRRFYELKLGPISDMNCRDTAVRMADAFYGDRGLILHDMMRLKKPSMIQDAKIIKS